MAFIFEPNDNTLSSAFNNAYSMGVQQSMENKRIAVMGLLEAIKNPTLNIGKSEEEKAALVDRYLVETGNQDMVRRPANQEVQRAQAQRPAAGVSAQVRPDKVQSIVSYINRIAQDPKKRQEIPNIVSSLKSVHNLSDAETSEIFGAVSGVADLSGVKDVSSSSGKFTAEDRAKIEDMVVEQGVDRETAISRLFTSTPVYNAEGKLVGSDPREVESRFNISGAQDDTATKRAAWDKAYGQGSFDAFTKNPANMKIVDEELNSGKTEASLSYKNSASGGTTVAGVPMTQDQLAVVNNEIGDRYGMTIGQDGGIQNISAGGINKMVSDTKESFSGAVKSASKSGEPYFAAQVRKVTNSFRNAISQERDPEKKALMIFEANAYLSSMFQGRGMTYSNPLDIKDLVYSQKLAHATGGAGGRDWRFARMIVKNDDGTTTERNIMLPKNTDPYEYIKGVAQKDKVLLGDLSGDLDNIRGRVQFDERDSNLAETNIDTKLASVNLNRTTALSKNNAGKLASVGLIPIDVYNGGLSDDFTYVEPPRGFKITPDEAIKAYNESNSFKSGVGGSKYKTIDDLMRVVLSPSRFSDWNIAKAGGDRNKDVVKSDSAQAMKSGDSNLFNKQAP